MILIVESDEDTVVSDEDSLWNLMKAKPFKLFSLLFLSSDLYDTHCGI